MDNKKKRKKERSVEWFWPDPDYAETRTILMRDKICIKNGKIEGRGREKQWRERKRNQKSIGVRGKDGDIKKEDQRKVREGKEFREGKKK